jgi:hypothetical protein
MTIPMKTLSPPVQRALDALREGGVLFIPIVREGESHRGTAWIEVPATGAVLAVSMRTVDALDERDFLIQRPMLARPTALAWGLSRRGRRWIDA